jgi:outer membrane lipoprotein SlyB
MSLGAAAPAGRTGSSLGRGSSAPQAGQYSTVAHAAALKVFNSQRMQRTYGMPMQVRRDGLRSSRR